jgi:hypothetical protein
MLFYLSWSVVKSIQTGNQTTLDVISRLIDSRKRGELLIHASKRNFKNIEEGLRAIGRISDADIISTVAKTFRELRQIARDVNRIVYVSTLSGQYREIGEKFLIVSPAFINNANLHVPPIMLGENLTDCELYVNAIAKNFTDSVPESLKEVKLSERFENGGGNSTHTVYSRHKKLNKDFCICVVDSDKNCPEEGLGDTAKFVVAVDGKGRSPLCRHLVIDMYSAENLLPLSELENEFVVGKSEEQIKKFEIVKKFRKTESWRYLALKKGVSGKDLKSKASRGIYWSKKIEGAEVNLPCCDDDDCNCIILPALNSKTLANIVGNSATKWRRLLNEEENAEIKRDYEKISMTLRSWLCVGRQIRS